MNKKTGLVAEHIREALKKEEKPNIWCKIFGHEMGMGLSCERCKKGRFADDKERIKEYKEYK